MADIQIGGIPFEVKKFPFSNVTKEILIYTHDNKWIIEREITFKYSDSDNIKELNPNDFYTTAIVHSEMSSESVGAWLERNDYGNDQLLAIAKRAVQILSNLEQEQPEKVKELVNHIIPAATSSPP